ncbi:MAG TPA: glycosyltransferase family 39 protein [Blastocatellia bacterium]|nr:glycosyltransferase family 39 protein [Blastocatellia bacterium]
MQRSWSLRPTTYIIAYRRWFSSALATRAPMRLKHKLIIAFSIFAVSYLVKSLQAVDLAHVMYTYEQPFSGLTETYDQRAASILAGEGLLGPYNIKPSRTIWIAQAPGYSIFLSAVYGMVGNDFFKVQLVQNAVNSLSPILIFLIAGHVLSWRAGAVAGFLSAISHHLSHISNFILPDSVSALPLLAGFYLMVLGRRSPKRAYLLFACAGVMFGLGAWLRSQTMLMAFFFTPLLALVSAPRRRAVKLASVMGAVSLLVIAPITIKNYIVYGEFVPINIGMGIVLWEGIGESSDRFGAVARDEEVAEQDALIFDNPRYAKTWSSPDGIMRDRARIRKSLDIIVHNPGWYAGVMFKRIKDMLKYSAHATLVYRPSEVKPRTPQFPVRTLWEGRVPDGSALAFGESLFWLRPAARFFQRIAKETAIFFIAIGAAMLFLASPRRGLLLMMCPLYYFTFQAFMHTEFRYTLPMQYFMFVFASVTWVALASTLRAGIRRYLTPSRARGH